MSTGRALPFLLLAIVLGAAGYLAGAVSAPFGQGRPAVRGELAPAEPQLRQQLEAARGEAAELTGELERAQATIDRLRGALDDTRARIAELQRRAEAAERARADAEARIGELAERVAALEAEVERAASAGTDTTGAAQTEAKSTESAAAPEVATAGPPAFDQDPRPTAQALTAISPTTGQANRLVAGVEAYSETAYKEAFLAWLPLAQQGYARAQLHLGALFLEGRGTERNDALAYAWLTIARDNGSQNAAPLLNRLRTRISQSDRDAARRLLDRARRRTESAG